MAKTKYPEAQIPLILRSQRLMDAFAKCDDERDFYLDRVEGFIIYVDLDASDENLAKLEEELTTCSDRYYPIPKLSFYETKKIMEGFIHEKVYDIDTKEKLLDIISSKEARENFLEFLIDHHAEFEKWQQYYQERSRVRIIEWLRVNNFHFVFEEDLDLGIGLLEKLKKTLFESKVQKDIANARKILVTKAKSYYSNEALNPRPKRGRPPKQAAKTELEPQLTIDVFNAVPPSARPFLYTPDSSATSSSFSSKFETEENLSQRKQAALQTSHDNSLESLNEKLAALRSLSSKWLESEKPVVEEVFEEEELPPHPKKEPVKKTPPPKAAPIKKDSSQKNNSPIPKTKSEVAQQDKSKEKFRSFKKIDKKAPSKTIRKASSSKSTPLKKRS